MQDGAPVARLGVFGGTFDPPHVGHLAAAAEVHHALGLERTDLVVAHQPWQKVGTRAVTDAATRLEMVEALIRGSAGLAASDVEIRRGGPSYTIDTVAELGGGRADRSIFVIVGADAARGVATWERADELRALVTLVVVDRAEDGGDVVGALPGWEVRRVAVPRLDVSSSDVRERVRQGRPIDGLVPPAVISVIETRGLYRGRSV